MLFWCQSEQHKVQAKFYILIVSLTESVHPLQIHYTFPPLKLYLAPRSKMRSARFFFSPSKSSDPVGCSYHIFSHQAITFLHLNSRFLCLSHLSSSGKHLAHSTSTAGRSQVVKGSEQPPKLESITVPRWPAVQPAHTAAAEIKPLTWEQPKGRKRQLCCCPTPFPSQTQRVWLSPVRITYLWHGTCFPWAVGL